MEEWEIIARWYRLRKLGLLLPLLHQPGGYFYVFEDIDPWETRKRILVDDLIALIVSAESARKGPEMERSGPEGSKCNDYTETARRDKERA